MGISVIVQHLPCQIVQHSVRRVQMPRRVRHQPIDHNSIKHRFPQQATINQWRNEKAYGMWFFLCIYS
jgi:hypothetical protein